jgi:hypothetical protein
MFLCASSETQKSLEILMPCNFNFVRRVIFESGRKYRFYLHAKYAGRIFDQICTLNSLKTVVRFQHVNNTNSQISLTSPWHQNP